MDVQDLDDDQVSCLAATLQPGKACTIRRGVGHNNKRGFPKGPKYPRIGNLVILKQESYLSWCWVETLSGLNGHYTGPYTMTQSDYSIGPSMKFVIFRRVA